MSTPSGDFFLAPLNILLTWLLGVEDFGSLTYLEFGAETGHEVNTRFLREWYGADGTLMDGGYADASIGLEKEFITAENINDLVVKYGRSNVDVLSVDIDRNDTMC